MTRRQRGKTRLSHRCCESVRIGRCRAFLIAAGDRYRGARRRQRFGQRPPRTPVPPITKAMIPERSKSLSVMRRECIARGGEGSDSIWQRGHARSPEAMRFGNAGADEWPAVIIERRCDSISPRH